MDDDDEAEELVEVVELEVVELDVVELDTVELVEVVELAAPDTKTK